MGEWKPLTDDELVDLLKPACRHGYTFEQVNALAGDRVGEFWRHFYGHTITICQGEECEQAHGDAHFVYDVRRSLNALRITPPSAPLGDAPYLSH